MIQRDKYGEEKRGRKQHKTNVKSEIKIDERQKGKG